jgi:hypothetical protein
MFHILTYRGLGIASKPFTTLGGWLADIDGLFRLETAWYARALCLEPLIVFVGRVNPHALELQPRAIGCWEMSVTPDLRPKGYCFLLPVQYEE